MAVDDGTGLDPDDDPLWTMFHAEHPELHGSGCVMASECEEECTCLDSAKGKEA